MTTVTFAYTGGAQSFVVPANVTSVQVECWGAAAGPALGGYAKATISTTPGETLGVYVGGQGSISGTGGWNGGGTGDGGSMSGGGGTDVRQGGTALANRVVIAGGAGGKSYFGFSNGGGAGGGTSGVQGNYDAGNASPAGAGTQTGGGAASPTGGSGTAGALGVGGNGGSDGGGGGGGYYGGGGGGSYNLGASGQAGAGGSGGSGYVPAGGTMTVGVRSGDGQVVLSYIAPPNAPALTSPATGSSVNVGATQRFSWNFSASTPGDSQSAFDLRYSSDSGATWTTINGSAPTQYVDVAPGTFIAGDSYEWQIRTYGSTGLVGPWSASSFFTAAAARDGPTITVPVAGSTIGTGTAPVTWSAPNQTAYQVRRVADNAGSPNTSIVYYDTGQITDSTTRTISVPFETNNRTEHIEVRVEASGLWSTWTDITVTVSYSAPETPGVTVTGDDGAGTITVTWTAPTPGAGIPATAYVDVWAQSDAEGTVRLATLQSAAGSVVYQTPASGVPYSFQVVAVGTNGVTAASDWT